MQFKHKEQFFQFKSKLHRKFIFFVWIFPHGLHLIELVQKLKII